VVLEGLAFGHYATGYDHPDKTMPGHPLLHEGGELCVRYNGLQCGWHTTSSTTMTFAATAAVLEADLPEWDTACADEVPLDAAGWGLLAALKGRRLVAPCGGVATHGETRWLVDRVPWPAIAGAAAKVAERMDGGAPPQLRAKAPGGTPGGTHHAAGAGSSGNGAGSSGNGAGSGPNEDAAPAPFMGADDEVAQWQLLAEAAVAEPVALAAAAEPVALTADAAAEQQTP
jgi:hypothetical protein